MSFLHAAVLAGASGNQGPYQIEQSLRFNQPDSYTFRRTPGANSTSQKKFTFSVWSKRWLVAAGTANNVGRQSIFYTGLSNGSGNLFGLEWRDDEVACIFNGAGSIYPQTVAKFRDASAWYHIVVAVDTDQATDTDRCKVYVNGVQQTLTGTLPTSGFVVTNGTTSVHSVGELGVLRSNQYLAEAYYINDQQLEPTDFAKTNNYGVWIPKPYEGTFTGTNSYYLKFDPAATNGIGHDYSGNGNNFTTTNFTTTGTGTDVFSDTPTTNWCTLNPLNRAINDLFDGNLVATRVSGTGFAGSTGTLAASSGKWYYEVTASTAAGMIGMVASSWTVNLNSALWYNNAAGYGYYGVSGNRFNNGSNSAYGSSWSNGDVIGVAMDLDNGAIYFAVNNTWQNSGDPTSGSSATGAAFSGIAANEFTPVVYAQDATAGDFPVTVNFGQRDFAHTPPTGYKALNTKNLPVPTIKDGSKYFNTVLYTGNGSTQSITGVGFQPDFVWAKSRDTAYGHWLGDVVRGGNERLASDATQEGRTNEGNITFDTDGFSVTSSHPSINDSSDAMVAWNWLAGGSGSSNTDGSITSTVSVNATAGFSIVSYTASGTDNDTVGHGLGVAPSFHIVKSRDSARDWLAYTREIDGSLDFLRLNTTAAAANSSANAPTSTVFSIYGADINTAGEDCIAYCFAEVEGYSKFGSYTGNGTIGDGPFVYCGFKPAFVLTKNADAVDDWSIEDATRDPHNLADASLRPNSSSAEDGAATIDILSNGFKVRTGNSHRINFANETFIFAAFAEHPTGGSGISPTTAR